MKYIKNKLIATSILLTLAFNIQSFASNKELDTFWDKVLAGEEIPQLDASIGTPLEIYKYGRYRVLLGTNFGSMTFVEKDGQYNISFKDRDKLDKSISTNKEALEIVNEYTKGLNANIEDIKSLYVKLTNTEYLYDNTRSGWDSGWIVLKYNTGICNGYARVFSEMLDELGVENYYIEGRLTNGGLHAWNSFVLDGKTYTVDATHASKYKNTDKIWNYFKEDGSMTLGDGRIVLNKY